MNKRYLLLWLVALATTTFGQPNPRLLQLENYLQEQGLKKNNSYKSNTKTTRVKHYWSGQLTAHTPKAVLDSIRTTFTDLSKEATESHMYENHKDHTDTIEYANKVNADMIAIMTEQESSLSSLIMGTFAQQMLSQSTIPVLTVRPRKVLADTANY